MGWQKKSTSWLNKIEPVEKKIHIKAMFFEKKCKQISWAVKFLVLCKI